MLTLSVAVSFAVYVPAVLGVPLMTPVEALTLRPVGRPVAVHTYGFVPPAATIVKVLATPVALPCTPGLVTITPVVQENVALPATLFVPVAVTFVE